MADRIRMNIESDNFNLFFAKYAQEMTEDQKESLPKEILYTIFKGTKFNGPGAMRLGFFNKMFILWMALRKNWFIVVQGEEGEGIGVEEFSELRKTIKRKDPASKGVEEFASSPNFVIANKELADTFAFMNNLSVSPTYNYLMRSKNIPKSKVSERKGQMTYVCRFLANYEGIKKKMVQDKRLSMSDIMVLFALYGGQEVKGNHLRDVLYKHSYHTSITKIKVSFGILQSYGYIVKIGNTKTSTFRITALGTNKIDEIMDKYIINP